MSDDTPTSPFVPKSDSAETADMSAVVPALLYVPLEPDAIGSFRILEKIGEGGMGVVYKAEQRVPVRRMVALKVIKLGMDTKDVVARFEAERQALAMLSHPHVAQVFDAGMTDAGRPYFAMEYVAGVPLTRYCDENKLTIKERLELFIPICLAVQHAHQKGIIHRDLKPTNVLVTLLDGNPKPKVIDFGIAKATNRALTQHTLFTHTGSLIGTPEYMSPEQAMTSGLDVDTRTDIYSLGVMLYELLTGTLPLDGKALREAGFEGMARLIKDSQPQKPSNRLLAPLDSVSSRNTRVIQKELRGDLDWIVLKAMEKDRTRRYETANALALDIQRHLGNEPVLARPPSATYRMQKFVRKHRVGVFAGSAILLALLTGLALATYGFLRAKADREIADKARIEAQSQRTIADNQRRLAIENARKADDNAKDAKLQLAYGLISQADAMSMAGRFSDAHSLYQNAYDHFVELRQPLFVAETGLWSSYQQAGFPLLTLAGHKGGVSSVAILPDGRTALSGSLDGTLKLWNLCDGKVLSTMTDLDGVISSIAILPDGQTALSGSWNGPIRLWDLKSGKAIRSIPGHKMGVSSVAIAPNGKTALSASPDKSLKLWDLSDGTVLHTFTGHTSGVYGVAFSPDGQTALSASDDKTLKLWDLASGQVLRTFTGHTNRVTCVAISPDGQTVVSGGWDNTVRVWEMKSGKELRTILGHTAGIYAVGISSDGQAAFSSGSDKMIKWWDLSRGKELRTFIGHRDFVTSVSVSHDSRMALSGSNDGTLKLWDLVGQKELWSAEGHTNWVNAVAVSPDGRMALSGSNDNTLKLWDLVGRKELGTLRGHSRGVRGVAFLPDGQTAVSGSDDLSLKIWDLASGKVLRTLTGHTLPVTSVAVAPGGAVAISGSRDGTLKLWDLATGKLLLTCVGHKGSVRSVAISPDGRRAISGCSDGTIKLWNLVDGKELRTLEGHQFAVLSVAIASDGQTALSGSEDKTLKLWDLSSGKLLRTFTGHVEWVMSVAFSPDGQTALSGGWDRTLKLWDIASGKELRSFSAHSLAVLAVAISPDGRTAVSGGADNSIKICDFARGVMNQEFEARLSAAQTALRSEPNDPTAMGILGAWYAFRGIDNWAIEFLHNARERGAAVAPLTLARCYWNLDRLPEALHEFQVAREQSGTSIEQQYLERCIERIRSTIQHRREAEGSRELAAATQLARRGHFKEAGDALKKVIAEVPDEHYAWYYQGCLLAYQHDVDGYKRHCQAMQARFNTSDNLEIIDRTTKTCLLLPGGGDPAEFVATADQLLGRTADLQMQAWLKLLKSAAQYRLADYQGCLKSARECNDLGLDYAPRAASLDLLIAMSSYRLKQFEKAESALDMALARMKKDLPPITDDHPLENMSLEDWLICQILRHEAESLIRPE